LVRSIFSLAFRLSFQKSGAAAWAWSSSKSRRRVARSKIPPQLIELVMDLLHLRFEFV